MPGESIVDCAVPVSERRWGRRHTSSGAGTLDAELGRYDLVGLSTGGLMAQHLALQQPEAVRRLALVVAGARLGPQGQEICRRWLELAEVGRWRELHGDLGAATVDGTVLRGIARAVLRLTGRTPTATEAADFATTVRADLDHDTSAALAGLRMPALVGGEVDPFFPAEVLAATASAIPQAELRVLEGRGHGVPSSGPGRCNGPWRRSWGPVGERARQAGGAGASRAFPLPE